MMHPEILLGAAAALAIAGVVFLYAAKPRPSDVAIEIAKAFENGPIVESDIDPLGICELEIEIWGKQVRASWYSLRSFDYPLDLTIAGDLGSVDGTDAKFIIRAAARRARGLTQERLDALDAERRKAVR